MSQQSPATRTECGANCQFAGLRSGANEMKVSQVCAGDEQHKTGEAKREPHDSSADTVRHGSLEGLESNTLAFVRRVLFAEIGGQSNHTLLCLLNRHAWFETSKLREVVGAAVGLSFRRKRHRLPDIHRAPKHRMLESGRHYPDDLHGLSIELDFSAYDVWVTAKTARPETIREHDHVICTGLEFFRLEYTAQRRRNAE